MALTVPNLQSSPTFDAQALLDQTDLNALAGTDDGNGVLSGCGVTPYTGSDMNIAIAAGTVVINGQSVSVSAVTSTAVGAASTYDRKDIVTVNSSGTVSVTAGTPCTTAGWSRSSTALPPIKPGIPSNSVLLAEVYVASTTTVIATGNILDKTAVMAAGNYVESYISSPVTLTATTFINITNVVLSAGTWLIIGRATIDKTSTTNSLVDIFIGPTSASATSAYGAASLVTSVTLGGEEYAPVTVTRVVTLSTSTTVYLEGYASVATTTALASSIEQTIGNVTGITAVRIS